MKNTKILFIRLYIGTLYSNFIVPLRGSNYIQLLYGNLQQGLVSLFEHIRWLVWQGRTNGLGQQSGRLRALLNAIKVSLKYHHQNTTEIPPGITTKRGQMSMNGYGFQPEEIGSIRVKSGQKIGADRGKSGQFLTNAGIKMRVVCDQMLPNATRKQGDQRRLKATKNEASTYHYLILPNNLFMFCVGQK